MDDQPTEMARFFDERADGYEDHMLQGGPFMAELYRRVAGAIAATDAPVTILDLGCGTGLEIASILARAPQARITGIDLSAEMLARLRRRYEAHAGQIRLICGSYEAIPFPGAPYDCAVSVMSLHHFEHGRKLALYRRIRRALRPGGRFINGDYIVTEEESQQLLAEYRQKMAALGAGAATDLYHIDIPFSSAAETGVLREAGFQKVEVCWEEDAKALIVATA